MPGPSNDELRKTAEAAQASRRPARADRRGDRTAAQRAVGRVARGASASRVVVEAKCDYDEPVIVAIVFAPQDKQLCRDLIVHWRALVRVGASDFDFELHEVDASSDEAIDELKTAIEAGQRVMVAAMLSPNLAACSDKLWDIWKYDLPHLRLNRSGVRARRCDLTVFPFGSHRAATEPYVHEFDGKFAEDVSNKNSFFYAAYKRMQRILELMREAKEDWRRGNG